MMTREKDKSTDDHDPFAAQLMGSYLAGRDEDIRLLERAQDNQNFDLVRMIGHNLYGSGGAYGIQEISEIGEKLERAADSGNSHAVKQEIKALRQLIARIKST